jgi:hypothetical protein
MRRRHTRVREDEPLPSMLAGDGQAAPPVPSPVALVLPDEREAAARLPDDLCITLPGTSGLRLLAIGAGLLGAGALGVYGVYWVNPCPYPPSEIDFAFVAAGVGALAWLANRDLMRPRREFLLLPGGITVDARSRVDTPRLTHIPWTEITDYTVSVDARKAFLRVESVRGFTLTLLDRPPRLSAREFIRRFVEQAERHPRAVPPQPRKPGTTLPDVTGARERKPGGCAALLGFIVLNSIGEAFLDPSFGQKMAGAAVLGVIALCANLWWTLDDAEVAATDRGSARLMAQLRRWLRRVLGIDVI